MAREKAFLQVGGPGSPTLLERQVGLLRALGIGTLMVSLRRDLSCSGLAGDPTVIHDDDEGQGPLGGIVTAMRRAPNRHLLVLAVDMPLVDAGLLMALFEGATLRTGAAPRARGGWEPLCALYPPRALGHAEALLAGPTPSPRLLVEGLARNGRMLPRDIQGAREARLRSWNCPEDLCLGA